MSNNAYIMSNTEGGLYTLKTKGLNSPESTCACTAHTRQLHMEFRPTEHEQQRNVCRTTLKIYARNESAQDSISRPFSYLHAQHSHSIGRRANTHYTDKISKN